MIKMKKAILLSALAVTSCFMLCSCKDEGEYIEVDNVSEDSVVTYSFLYNGYNIDIGAKWKDVQGKLGDYNSTFVAESCAYQGTDRYYYYDDFEIMTSEIDGKELLTDIYIEKENVEAVNGVCVGMGLSQLAEKMGPADKTTDNSYIYYGDGLNVQINAKDDKVVSIEYYYVQE